MDETWVKVFLKNGQFETANNKDKKKEDHIYDYLVNKYKNVLDIPQTPKRKRIKTQTKNKSKINNFFKDKSFEHTRPLYLEEKGCVRCTLKQPNRVVLEEKKSLNLKPKKAQSVVFSKKKLSNTFGLKDIVSPIAMVNSFSTRPISLSTINKRAGFIRKPI
jgi:hypothetical protein